jgi:SAM-dependent methyltransferase
MEPRYGRLYAAAVLRPFAEQLIDSLGVGAGDSACDVVCDRGTLTAALVRAVEPGGTVFAADVDAALAAAAAADERPGSVVRAIVCDGSMLPLPDASLDRAGCLFTLGFVDGAELVADVLRATRPGGRIVVFAWDPDHPPAHEAALKDALREETGIASPFLAAVLSRFPSGPPSARVARVHDVVRFDGFAHYWAAAVAERPVRAELDALPGDAAARVHGACDAALQRFAAADGTLRIPVSALAVTLTA